MLSDETLQAMEGTAAKLGFLPLRLFRQLVDGYMAVRAENVTLKAAAIMPPHVSTGNVKESKGRGRAKLDTQAEN